VRVVHVGGGALGQPVLDALRREPDDVVVADSVDAIRAAIDAGPVDWLVSAGFREIVPGEVLALVGDSVNVHTSLLPWGRGAHPNAWAIADGEPAGVSLHRMVQAVDAGDVWEQRGVEVRFDDRAVELHVRLTAAAVELFRTAWPRIRNGAITPAPQPPGGSHHRVRDLASLVPASLDEQVTWRRALDVLRALTFPPHRNVVVEHDGRRYAVELVVTDVTDEHDGGGNRR
jgi:methionyl-tRNA formyltransferase